MGQRPAAQPSEPEDQQFAACDPAMLGGKFLRRRIGGELERSLGGARQRAGNVERIGQPLDQLDAEREADLAGDDADRIEQRLVIVTHRRAAHPRHDCRTVARQFERIAIDQCVEQFGLPRQLVRQYRSERQRGDQPLGEIGPRIEQAEGSDRTGHAFEDALPAIDRAHRIIACRHRPDERGREPVPRRQGLRGTDRGMASVAPALDPLSEGFGLLETERGEFLRQIARRCRRGGGCRARADQLLVDARGAACELGQFRHQRRAVRQPVKLRNIVERRALGQGVGLAVVDHLQAVFDVA